MNIQCPIPLDRYPEVTLAHGGGGRLMNQLIEGMFLAAFENAASRERHDGAVIVPPAGALALSTDSFVVRPLVFPGGSIGSLAVYGTANDLVMCGARPLCLTAGFILEEGLPMAGLWREVLAMKDAARGRGCGDRHRRHQGGGTRQGRRHVRQHERHRRCRGGIARRAPPRSAPATRSS